MKRVIAASVLVGFVGVSMAITERRARSPTGRFPSKIKLHTELINPRELRLLFLYPFFKDFKED